MVHRHMSAVRVRVLHTPWHRGTRGMKSGPCPTLHNPSMLTPCVRCRGHLWTCEAHQDRPWPHDDCRSAGEPCPLCNGSPVVKVPPVSEPHHIWNGDDFDTAG